MRLSVDDILQMPVDWIPPADWTEAELGLMRYMFVEYFLSVGDIPRAFRWAKVLSPMMPDKFLLLHNVRRAAAEGTGSVPLMAAGAYTGLVLEAYRRHRENS